MDEMTVQVARIELWSDLIKIGIPAVAGLVSGLIVGLVPYFIERRRLDNASQQENINFYRGKITDLVDALALFSGHLYRYISALQSSMINSNDVSDEYASHSGQEMLANEYYLKKARAIAGLIGAKKLLASLEEFDGQASKAIQVLIKRGPGDPEDAVRQLKVAEKRVMSDLDYLLSEKDG